jgi:hypothetical protein
MASYRSPPVQRRERFSRNAITRSVDAELAVGAAVHMHPASSELREDRLASGEFRVSGSFGAGALLSCKRVTPLDRRLQASAGLSPARADQYPGVRTGRS